MDIKIEKLTLFSILMVLSVLCINQNIQASETSGEVIDKLANEITGEISIQDSNGTVSLEQARTWISEHPEIGRIITNDRFRFTGLDYDSINALFPKDKLPVLYRLLDDEQYASYWANISKVIGYVSNDPNSIPVLLNYFMRDDGEKVNYMSCKIRTLSHIGKIGGPQADSILKKAITKEGAKELAKSWLDAQKWQEKMQYNTKDKVIEDIQDAALEGLIFTAKQENWKIVADLYSQSMQDTIKSKEMTPYMSSLAGAMGLRDFVIDHNNDVKAYYRIQTDKLPGTMSSYIQNYLAFFRNVRGDIGGFRRG
ncbi:MAG: hypothetical protein JW787_15010 [Sedimentisphaerales bacterium]|nr:hypothetical protein [Sedimentisphaerales bacterium]